jgi:hypothetical protein
MNGRIIIMIRIFNIKEGGYQEEDQSKECIIQCFFVFF